VIANEVDRQTMYKYAPAFLKAYARDLKAYMQMCDSHADSPTRGQMRNIPLLYAKSDDGGDPKDEAFAQYLFCGSSNVSIDIFGLNIERYCGPNGDEQYKQVNKWVAENKFPGAFLHTEEGCSKIPYGGTRDWAQIHGFFEKYPSIDGFFGYTYWNDNQPEWSMFDGPTASATLSQDGHNFFDKVSSYGNEPTSVQEASITPKCDASKLDPEMETVESVNWYDTGDAGYAQNCPKPFASLLEVIV